MKGLDFMSTLSTLVAVLGSSRLSSVTVCSNRKKKKKKQKQRNRKVRLFIFRIEI